jgi:predicted acylesterase/phospholipase RssA
VNNFLCGNQFVPPKNSRAKKKKQSSKKKKTRPKKKNMPKFISVGSFLFLLHAAAAAPTCRILALGGGGDRGAFEAGAISGLVDCLPAGDAQWDVVTGISAGSINAAAVAQFPIGQEPALAEFVTSSWSALSRPDVWREWPDGGVIAGWGRHSGLLDSSPERDLLERLVNATAVRSSGRRLLIGSTRLNDGELVIFNETFSDIHTAVMASSAIPGVFPTVQIGEHQFVDGGVNQRAPVNSGVAACRELYPGIEDSSISVDVTLAIGSGNFSGPVGNITTPQVLLHTISDMLKGRFIKDIQNLKLAFPDIAVRVVEPLEPLPGIMIGFNNAELKEMIKIGYNTAVATCKSEQQQRQQKSGP